MISAFILVLIYSPMAYDQVPYPTQHTCMAAAKTAKEVAGSMYKLQAAFCVPGYARQRPSTQGSSTGSKP